MAKKIEYEVDVDTSKAKQKLSNLGNIEASGSPAKTAASDGQAALDLSSKKAARSLDNLSKQTGVTDASMKRMVRGFAGIGVGLATSYAASHMQEGRAKNAVEYAGSAVSGAAAGAMIAGPIGAAIGGVTSLLKTYLDKEGAKNQASQDYATSERRYESDKAFKDFFDNLNDFGDKTKSSAERLEEAKEKLASLKEGESKIKGSIERNIEGGYMEAAQHQQTELGRNRAEQNALEGFITNLERKIRDTPEARESTSALDSLSKLGASFGGGDFARDQLNVARDQLSVLKSIEQKTGKGGDTWQ